MTHRFGPLLRKLRTDAGVTMGQLARHLDTSVTFVSRVESSKSSPLNRERILQACELIGAHHVEELLRAAAEDQESYKIPTYSESSLARRLVTALARGRNDWTDEDVRQAMREAGINIEDTVDE